MIAEQKLHTVEMNQIERDKNMTCTEYVSRSVAIHNTSCRAWRVDLLIAIGKVERHLKSNYQNY